MSCITVNTHLDAMSTSFYSTNIAMKLSAVPTFHAALPGLLLLKKNHNHTDCAREQNKKISKSFCSLDQLIREAHKISTSTSCTFATCSSTPKLDQLHWNSEDSRRPPEQRNASTRNAVFEVQSSRRRHPQALMARYGLATRLKRKELLLDDTGSLRRRMSEYRRQVKSRTFIPDVDSDSDEEDQE
mmetsp:Transcript_28109/g.68457  ORF Transcript_28109/g.68457 Transcript_28109/m.68457 type:complete len:186 (-) Transcript_28109:22-579(-)